MACWNDNNWILLPMLAALAACPPKPTPIQAPPAAPPQVAPPAAGASSQPAAPPGAIAIECTPRVNGYQTYRVQTVAQNAQVCSVGGDGKLTLHVRGEGSDSVSLLVAGYHGAGNYPLTGESSLTLGNSTPRGGTSQSTTNCAVSSDCDVSVVDSSASAPPGTPHSLDFAVNCAHLCDSDTHQCTATAAAGGSITWSGRADCTVR